MSIYKKYFYTTLLLILTIPSTLTAQEGGTGTGGGTGGTGTGGSEGFRIEIPNPLKGISTLQDFVQKVLENVVIPIGSVVVVMAIIYSGFMFVTARGNPTKLESAKKGFLAVVIGSAILLGSWLIATAIKGTVDQLLAFGPLIT